MKCTHQRDSKLACVSHATCGGEMDACDVPRFFVFTCVGSLPDCRAERVGLCVRVGGSDLVRSQEPVKREGLMAENKIHAHRQNDVQSVPSGIRAHRQRHVCAGKPYDHSDNSKLLQSHTIHSTDLQYWYEYARSSSIPCFTSSSIRGV